MGCALVTLVAIDGGAARSLGAHMAIRADGTYCGYVSGGCVEAAVAAEALAAIRHRRDRNLVLGKGSPYFDIVLPCGGGITLAIHVLREGGALSAVVAALKGRKRIGLAYDPAEQTLEVCPPVPASDWQQSLFVCVYRPRPQILLFGGTLELNAISRLSVVMGYRVLVCGDDGEPTHLARLIDQDTAIALLFHSTEKELVIFDIALSSPAFYVGHSVATEPTDDDAMNSRAAATPQLIFRASRHQSGFLPKREMLTRSQSRYWLIYAPDTREASIAIEFDFGCILSMPWPRNS
jgi:xanthine dehydrogenase accessory factor